VTDAMKFATRQIAIVIGIVAVAVSGCARRVPSAPVDYLQVDINVAPTTLDPRLATDAMSGRIGELVYDSMVKFDRSGNPIGDLAERIEQTSPTRLTFHLRHGVRFSDGRGLTARDVKSTYDAVNDPELHSMKRATLAELAAMEIVDDYSVAMTTRRPYAPALEMATLPIVPYGALPPGSIAQIAPIGSGPFRFAEYRRDEAIVLVRNPARPYQLGAARGIVLKVVPDATVRALELVEGICDFAENDGVQRDLIPYLARQNDLRIEQSPGNFVEYLAFNFRDPRLRDVRIRSAFAYAIDREAIVHAMLRDTARVATGLLTPENWAYAGEVTRYPYDPAAARRLLEEAGYTPGDRRLRFVYKTTPEGRRLAEVIQAMLKRVGVILEIHTNEWATFYADLQRGNFDLAASQLAAASPHEYYLFHDSRMMPPRGNNRGAYQNPAMDALVEAADATIDLPRRRTIYAEIQQIAARDLPLLPLWWIDTVTVVNRRLKGVTSYPDGSLRSLAAATYTPGSERRAFGD
jgi:peptide/nickel transport system substrate-binding protein